MRHEHDWCFSEEVMDTINKIYELYKPCVRDSAIFFLREGIKLADLMGNRRESIYCRSLMAMRCTNIGMYDEALMTLDSINTDGVDQEALGVYYKAYNNVYNEHGCCFRSIHRSPGHSRSAS